VLSLSVVRALCCARVQHCGDGREQGAGGIVAASAAAGRGFDSGRGLVVSRIPEGRERAQR